MNARKLTTRTRRAARGFTLIELLTVIAIIGILAAILIPTLGTVRATAKQSVCASNLRQISMAVIAYANDNRQMLPAGRSANGQYNGTYRGIVPPGVSYSDSKSVNVIVTTENGNGQLSGVIASYLDTGKNTNIWLCPGNTAAFDALANGTTYICNNQSDTVPAYFFGQQGGGTTTGVPKKLNVLMSDATERVTEHSRIWMISDIDSVNYTGSTGLPAGIDAPHRGARNYSFFDGHVEARKADNFPVNP